MTVAKGAVITELNKGWEIQELEWDEPRDNEVGVRIAACGVCRSDWHFTNGTSPVEPLPYLSGHEGTGIVEKVGKNVKRVKVGDKIVFLNAGAYTYYADFFNLEKLETVVVD